MNKPRLLLNAGMLLGLQLSGLSAIHAADPAMPADKLLNLARSSSGTRLTVQTPAAVQENTTPRAAQALLTDDDPLGYELVAGTTDVLLTLPRTELVHRLNFLNLTAAGRVSVAVSSVQLPAESPRWRSVTPAMDFSDQNEVVSCDLGSAEAKYLKITLDVRSPGRIDTLGLFGRATVAGTTEPNPRAMTMGGGKRTVGYEFLDYGNAAARARVARVSSGPGIAAADGMIDGNLKTSYAFAATDQRPMAVVDLGMGRTLTRVSIAYKAAPGRLDFYLIPDPTQRAGLIRTAASSAGLSTAVAGIPEVTNEAGFPGDRKPVGSITTDGRAGLNRATVSISGESGRFLVVVFTPRGGGRASGMAARVDVKDFKDSRDYKDAISNAEAPASASDTPLEISELTAFGPPPGAFTSITELPPGGSTIPPISPVPPISVVTP